MTGALNSDDRRFAIALLPEAMTPPMATTAGRKSP